MERKIALVPAVLAVIVLGWITGWAVPAGREETALVAFALTMVFVHGYFSYLERRGLILEDERTLRINEIASRRTLQITMIALAVVMLLLSGKTSDPELRGAQITVSLVLAGIGVLHLVFRHYYARRM